MPHTQGLLPDGTWFPNLILTTLICCPSRATLLTGRYAHNNGVYDNDLNDPLATGRPFALVKIGSSPSHSTARTTTPPWLGNT